MATGGVPSGTILAVHLQKCSHLSNEIRVMQICLTFMIYFLTFMGKLENKNLHIQDTRSVFILFYLSAIKYNDPAVKI
jgi:hypothetical protein